MSFSNAGEKRYGLIIPGKKSNEAPKAPAKSAFDEDSEDEDDAKFKQPNFDVKLETLKANLRKKTKINIEKALEEDASIFLYDEVYDEINKDKDSKVLQKCLPSARKPKYVEKLLKASAVRKLEHELLSERKAQRDLEAEKDKFADKESFVTGAYKEKMSEIRQLVERRQVEETREEVMDVTKQDGLGGFYRFMYQQKTASKDPEELATNLEMKEKSVDASSGTSRTTSSKATEIEEFPKGSFDKAKYSQDGVCSPEAKDSHQVEKTSQSDCSSHSSRKHSDSSHRDSHHTSHRHQDPLHRRNGSTSEKSDFRRSTDHHHEHGHHRGVPVNRSGAQKPSGVSVSNTSRSPKRAKTPPGFIRAKPRSTMDEELSVFRARFLSRKEAGIHADIVLSDDEI